MSTHHEELVLRIIDIEYKTVPSCVERMTIGLCNEVYKVTLASDVVFVRMNMEVFELLGSSKHLPVFASLGIPVPKILASDYTKTVIPYAYQVQSCVPGKDMGLVMESLSDEQLRSIAREIATIFKKLRQLPTNGKFGWVGGDESRLVDSWTEIMNVDKVSERNMRTGVVGEELVVFSRKLFEEYKSYFDSVESVFYYDDISSKNVLIDGGVFTGLIDIDTVVYGDPLEAVGSIKASWYGTHHGEVYTQAIENELGLNAFERKVVTMYALFSRIWWLSEKGMKFNDNTSDVVDHAAADRDRVAIEGLRRELEGNRDTARR
jgi:aminoglycoside phosphotransferase (APT) family kinase protein